MGNKICHHSDVAGAAPACRRCSNNIFIIDLTPGFNGLVKDETRNIFNFWIWCAYIRSLTVIWFKFNSAFRIIKFIIKRGVKYSYPSQNLKLQFGNRYLVSFHTLLGMWLLSHVEIIVNQSCLLKGTSRQDILEALVVWASVYIND